jgi:uncharacterized protein (DUF342 family)
VLFEESTGGRLLRGWATADGTAAGIDCHVAARPWKGADADGLADVLGRHGVTGGLDRSALETVAEAARRGEDSRGCVVARGTPAEPGLDGALEFIVRPAGKPAGPPAGGDKVDYRETNIVQNALAGEPIAIEIPPRPGRDGTDVFGKPVKAPEGKPVKFRTGEGARFDEESRQVIAEMDGRVIWENGVVSVSRTFHVEGSVDYSVGNIAFVGDVTIDGDVLDGFNVRSGGALTVGGNVGACRLDSEGDLVVKGGVFGKGRARLRAKGRLTARFLNDCQAESSADMVVEREAIGSTLMTNSSLSMLAGRLVGGKVSALRGVDVDVLGSPLGVPTSVAAGTDYNLARRQAEVESRIEEVDASVEKISEFLSPLLGDRRRITDLIGRRRDDMQRLLSALRELRAERGELAASLEDLAESTHRGAIRQINIGREMHPGVLLEIGSVRHRVKKEARGPLTVVEDRGSGSLRTAEYRPLPAPKGGEARQDKDTTEG